MSRELIEQTREDRRSIGRRQFLRDVAIAGAGLAGLSLLGEADAAGPGWGDWQNLGVPPGQWNESTPAPAAGQNLDGRLELFLVGYNEAEPVTHPTADRMPVWHLWQTAPDGPWSAWAKLSSNPPGMYGFPYRPAVVRNQNGRMEVFAVQSMDGPVWHIAQTAPNDGWTSWDPLGGVTAWGMAVGRNPDGRLELFVKGTDRALWRLRQDAFPMPGTGEVSWTWPLLFGVTNWHAWTPGWTAMGGQFDYGPVVGYNEDGRMELFVVGTDKALYHRWQLAPGGEAWSDWASHGGQCQGEPAVAQNADGRMEVVVRHAWDSSLWHIWQGVPNGPFSGWDPLGAPSDNGWLGNNADPVIGRGGDGRLEILAGGMAGAVFHRRQIEPNDGWSDWESLGYPLGTPGAQGYVSWRLALGQGADGQLYLFAQHPDTSTYCIQQT